MPEPNDVDKNQLNDSGNSLLSGSFSFRNKNDISKLIKTIYLIYQSIGIEFKNFYLDFFDFKGSISRSKFCLSLVINSWFFAWGYILSEKLWMINGGLVIWVSIPYSLGIISLIFRRLNDAGRKPIYFLIIIVLLLLPIVRYFALIHLIINSLKPTK